MSLERLFASVENLRGTAAADAAFGEPQQAEAKFLIPVAAVGTGFALGFELGGTDDTDDDALPPVEDAESGAVGAAHARPVAVIEVTPEATTIRPIVDETAVAIAGITLAGWVVFWITVVLRSVFGGQR